MNSSSLIKNDHFKCFICKNYLSYFPIFIIDDDLNICGRCRFAQKSSKVPHFRNSVYEIMAQEVRFPCRYEDEGCHREFFPKEMASHEETCYFKTVKCPGLTFARCSWTGCRTAVLTHCQNEHKDVFLKNEWMQLNSGTVYNFLEYDGALFIAYISNNGSGNVLSYSVYCAEDEVNVQKQPYQLVLKKGEMYIIVHHVTTDFIHKKEHEVALETLKNNDNKEELILVKIVFEKTVDDVISERRNINQNLLSILRCSVCEDLVLPPVCQFEDKTVKCVNCIREGDGYIRNFNLDKIAELLDYPCRYMKNGCDVVLKPENMKKHLSVCFFKTFSCPIGLVCLWSGVKNDITRHVQTTHPDSVVGNNEKISEPHFWNTGDEFRKSYLIRIDDYLFELMFWVNDTEDVNNALYSWEVHALGHGENFMYEIEITDSEHTNGRFLMSSRKKCLVFNDGCSAAFFTYKEEYYFCYADQILPLLGLRDITFKAHIFPV